MAGPLERFYSRSITDLITSGDYLVLPELPTPPTRREILDGIKTFGNVNFGKNLPSSIINEKVEITVFAGGPLSGKTTARDQAAREVLIQGDGKVGIRTITMDETISYIKQTHPDVTPQMSTKDWPFHVWEAMDRLLANRVLRDQTVPVLTKHDIDPSFPAMDPEWITTFLEGTFIGLTTKQNRGFSTLRLLKKMAERDSNKKKVKVIVFAADRKVRGVGGGARLEIPKMDPKKLLQQARQKHRIYFDGFDQPLTMDQLKRIRQITRVPLNHFRDGLTTEDKGKIVKAFYSKKGPLDRAEDYRKEIIREIAMLKNRGLLPDVTDLMPKSAYTYQTVDSEDKIDFDETAGYLLYTLKEHYGFDEETGVVALNSYLNGFRTEFVDYNAIAS